MQVLRDKNIAKASDINLKEKLDLLVAQKNQLSSLFSHPDPLQIAHLYKEPVSCLACSLFAYGNAKQILGFLKSFCFSLIHLKEKEIKKELLRCKQKYRFQNTQDIIQIYITLARLKQDCDIYSLCKEVFDKTGDMKEVIKALIEQIYLLNPYRSRGYEFFWGQAKSNGPFKRYNMYFRWMIRDDELDLGLFKGFDKAKLCMPLDTHTQKVGLKLGLLSRKTYDFKAALELTKSLSVFCPSDPLKYDFALYRIGQLDGYRAL